MTDSPRTIAVVDYGMGNLRSVSKAIEHVANGAQVRVTSDPAVIAKAERVVVPGQGAMPDCMRELEARGLRAPVLEAARGRPFLGICIGLQMLFDWSEEGGARGLGVFAGAVRRFPEPLSDRASGARLKVPHMGWNEVRQSAPHALWEGIDDGSRFYFVHSYHAEATQPEVRCGRTDYGLPFTCAVARDNIFAVQFHPEKSQSAGLQLLSNFIRWRP